MACETARVTAASSSFLVLAAVFAVLDWVAVARGSSRMEYVAKPAATAMFLAAAAMLDVEHGAAWVLLLMALVCCVAGDVFLMLPRDAFVPGLASFAVAQVLFAASFVAGGLSARGLVAGVVVAGPVAALLARRFIGALRGMGRTGLVAPVATYMLLIAAMAMAAAGSGSPVAVAGAASFMVSDSLIAESRFVAASRWHPVAIMVTYHAALAGLVLGLR
jgi:uncharacterized membrane protein YhhN